MIPPNVSEFIGNYQVKCRTLEIWRHVANHLKRTIGICMTNFRHVNSYFISQSVETTIQFRIENNRVLEAIFMKFY